MINVNKMSMTFYCNIAMIFAFQIRISWKKTSCPERSANIQHGFGFQESFHLASESSSENATCLL